MSVLIGSIGEYEVLKELGEGAYVGRDKGGGKVVLKMLGADCLLKGQLHPMIRDRLGRVRELAHLGVANLRGAERDGERAFLVWEFVEGRSLEEYLREGGDRGMVEKIARDIAAHVEGLHGLGIVHGSLHARNVIVMRDGAVKLTHVSPLLYHEESVDGEAMKKLFEEMGVEVEKKKIEEEKKEDGIRRWALIGAIVAAVVGGVIAWWIWKNAVNEMREPVAIEHAHEYVGMAPTLPAKYAPDYRRPPYADPLPEGEGIRPGRGGAL